MADDIKPACTTVRVPVGSGRAAQWLAAEMQRRNLDYVDELRDGAAPMESPDVNPDSLSMAVYEVARKAVTYRPDARVGSSGVSRRYDEARIAVDVAEEIRPEEYDARKAEIGREGYAYIVVRLERQPFAKNVKRLVYHPVFPMAENLRDAIRLAVEERDKSGK